MTPVFVNVFNRLTTTRDLCEQIELRERLAARITAEGLTLIAPSGEVKSHPLLPKWLSVSASVRTGFKDFLIMPLGKPIELPAPAAADPFAEFEQSG